MTQGQADPADIARAQAAKAIGAHLWVALAAGDDVAAASIALAPDLPVAGFCAAYLKMLELTADDCRFMGVSTRVRILADGDVLLAWRRSRATPAEVVLGAELSVIYWMIATEIAIHRGRVPRWRVFGFSDQTARAVREVWLDPDVGPVQ